MEFDVGGGQTMTLSESDLGTQKDGAQFQRFTLPGGRSIAWREYGNPIGNPVFYFHGTPGSSIEGAVFHEAALSSNCRIISPDRPGIGHSDFLPGRRLADWPADVRQIADHLGIPHFSVLGWSGGGLHALACAVPLEKRLVAVGMIAPQSSRPPFYTNSHIAAAKIWLPAVRTIGSMPMVGESILDASFKFSDSHRAGRSNKGIYQNIFTRSLKHALSAGSTGAVHDNEALLRNWGFTLEEAAAHLRALSVPLPITIWQGEKDKDISLSGTKAMAQALPHATLVLDPAAAHIEMLLDHTDEVLKTLTRPRQSR